MRRGRAASPRGLGLPAKAGLLAGLAALVAVVATILLSGLGTPAQPPNLERNRFGLLALRVAAGGDTDWWKGASEVKHDRDWIQKRLIDLFGDPARRFWDAETEAIVSAGNLSDLSPDEREELRQRKQRYDEASARLSGSGRTQNDATRIHRKLNGTVVPRFNGLDPSERFSVTAVWIREPLEGAKEGRFLAGTVKPEAIVMDLSKGLNQLRGDAGWIDGAITSSEQTIPVRIFTGRAGDPTGMNPLQAYVAVYDQGAPGTGGPGPALLMVLVGPLLAGVGAYNVASRHVQHMRSLAREIDRLGASGDPGRALHAKTFEAALVARSVERMVGNLDVRARFHGQDLEEVVGREQQIAQEIHGGLMNKNPPRLENYEVETLFKPGYEIGGDHFEYFAIDEQHLGIILLDTNVRGVPAALVIASAKAYVRAFAAEHRSPAELLRRVNDKLTGDLPPGRHVTALYLIVNTDSGSVTVASAGHLPLLVYRRETARVTKVNPEGLALGLDRGAVFDRSLVEGEIPIGPGDRIVLYTDGILKARNAEGEEFGEARFYEVVKREAPKNSQAFVNFVGSTVDQFHIDAPQHDDLTISTVKRLR